MSILDNPWFIAYSVTAITFLAAVLLLVFCPRLEEIRTLKKQLKDARTKIERMSKQQTTAELEHVADMEQLRGDQAAAEQSAKNVAARVEQIKGINRQISEAADKIREGAAV